MVPGVGIIIIEEEVSEPWSLAEDVSVVAVSSVCHALDLHI
jgi:hypothetical protein